jgi:Tfp pilus assembly protein PilN
VITRLNLSSKPFRNRNLPYILAVLLLAFAAVGAVLSFSQLRSNGIENEKALSEISAKKAEIKGLQDKGMEVQQELSPEQRALLTAAHKLVANKTFGWSRLFADLEAVLPGSVSASRIAVQNVYQDGDRIKAELEFAVLSRDYPAVMDMIQRMNNSGIFQAELRGQDLQKNERITYSEYTLRLIYTPAYGYSAAAPSAVVAQNGGGQ